MREKIGDWGLDKEGQRGKVNNSGSNNGFFLIHRTIEVYKAYGIHSLASLAAL